MNREDLCFPDFFYFVEIEKCPAFLIKHNSYYVKKLGNIKIIGFSITMS